MVHLKLDKQQDLRNSTRIFGLKLSQQIGNQSSTRILHILTVEVDGAQQDVGLREPRVRLSSAALAS